MKQEDKDLLLKDLCARLPYGVKVLYENKVFSVDYISAIYEEIKLDIPDNYTIDISDIKPYLFPLSSMDKKQTHKFLSTCNGYCEYNWTEETFDWFNKNHIDYRGLIEKGLAIDATGLNIY